MNLLLNFLDRSGKSDNQICFGDYGIRLFDLMDRNLINASQSKKRIRDKTLYVSVAFYPFKQALGRFLRTSLFATLDS